MGGDSCWGGQLEFTALAQVLQFNVLIYNVGQSTDEYCINNPMESVPVLRLSFHFGNHYNCVVDKSKLPLKENEEESKQDDSSQLEVTQVDT